MRETKLSLKVHPNYSIPINVQIKEQLKWLIGCGLVKSGEYLPPTNQLAAQLKVNRNTINWVYTQLRDEGLVSLHKGKGTQVNDGAEVEELQAKRGALLAFVQKFVQDAQAQNLNFEEVIESAFAYLQLFNPANKTPQLRIQFIECKEHDHAFYKTEIERLVQSDVEAVYLEDLKGKGASEEMMDIDLIITTLDHVEEVRELVSETDKKILTIAATADMSMLIDIAKLTPGTKVAFIGRGRLGGHWMAQRVKDAGITQIESISQGIDSLDKLLSTVESANCIYASSAVHNQIKKLAPDKTFMFSLKLEKGSETLLRDLVKV